MFNSTPYYRRKEVKLKCRWLKSFLNWLDAATYFFSLTQQPEVTSKEGNPVEPVVVVFNRN